jgi:hypothetical protein
VKGFTRGPLFCAHRTKVNGFIWPREAFLMLGVERNIPCVKFVLSRLGPKRQAPVHPTVRGFRCLSKQWVLCCFAGLVLTIPLNPELFGHRMSDVVVRQSLAKRETCSTGLRRAEAGAAASIGCPP